MNEYRNVITIGGFDDNSPLDSVERYDPRTDQWTMVASMSCPRGGVGVDALGSKIYAVGGHDGTNYLSSVELYDPRNDRLALTHLFEKWFACSITFKCVFFL